MKNDGGPAYPVQFDSTDDSVEWGMSLRDYFAGQALAGIAVATDSQPDHCEWSWPNVAAQAYRAADAMLKERRKH